jgi:hypothetical protein
MCGRHYNTFAERSITPDPILRALEITQGSLIVPATSPVPKSARSAPQSAAAEA